MKKKSLFLIPALFGMFLAGCNSGGETSKSEEKGSETTTSVTSTTSQQATTSEQNNSQAPATSSATTGSNPVKNEFLITFVDENGNVLDSRMWPKGSYPHYDYNKPSTAEWAYYLNGWATTYGGNPGVISAANEDATYYAVVSATKRQYNVKFYDEYDQLIKNEPFEYGTQPSCDYVGPNDNEEWDYTFVGWSASKGGAVLASLPNVTGEASYYAIVSSNKQQYSITFADENGNKLDAIKYSYEEVPSYTYSKDDTQEFNYTVIGWSTSLGGELLDVLPKVVGNATYYAVVSCSVKKYTITFDSNGGSEVNSITRDYGTSIDEPTKPTKQGYKFVGWTSDEEGTKAVTWPYTLVDNVTFYAQWNEKVNIKAYFNSLLQIIGHDPYSYIPNSLRQNYSKNFVPIGACNYDFINFTDVSDITYGGHGEQWRMVIENIEESEKFYSVLSLGEGAINSSVVLFNNFLDNNVDDTATHTIKDTAYTAKLNFKSGVLTYTIQYKTNLDIPFFGEVMPQVDMTYDITTLEKAVRIQLTENNAMKYIVTNNSYVFALEYGVETVSRKAYFQIDRNDENGGIAGHIYEFVQYKDKDLVPSCADFYITDEYTTVVGNKASGLVGFKGYINELYETREGKLIGYEVRETLTFASISGQYNTLWFNLNNISGITSVKAIENENHTGTYTNKNPHDIYLNGSSTKFEPTYNTKAFVKTSRKYDVELRKQYFYGYDSESNFVKYECEIPMMFIQADNDKDTNFSDFPGDILKDNKINGSVNLASEYIEKIQEDYALYIDIFIEHKDTVTGEAIENYIGNAIVIE